GGARRSGSRGASARTGGAPFSSARRRRSTPFAVSSRKKRAEPSGDGAGEKAPPVTRVRVAGGRAPAASKAASSQTPVASVAAKIVRPSRDHAGAPNKEAPAAAAISRGASRPETST